MTLHLSNVNQEAYLAWASEQLDLKEDWPESARALAVLDGALGVIRAVIVTVQTYTGIIDGHIASDGTRGWATRATLSGIFDYVFHMREAQRFQTVIAPDNRDTLIMCIKLGFTIEATLAAAMDDGGPGVLMSMTPDTCKWIKESHDG